MSTEQLAKWLRIAIKQNEHDVQLTDEEIREARAALAEHEAEKAQAVDEQPFAWATCDGEGSYDLRLFVDNEDYKDELIKRNPRYASWVIPLYERPAAPASASEAPVAKAKRLIGWRSENYLHETADRDTAINWEPHIGVLPIFEGDENTSLKAPVAPVDVPEGFALVPLRMTTAMQYVTEQEDWTWEDLLASAEAITEEQYGDIAAAPDAVCMGRDELINMLDDLVPLLQSHVRSVRDWREQHAATSAPASASEAPLAVPLTDELTGKLMRIHAALGKMGKKYGEIGSRDVDVARWNADLCEAIRAVGDVLADQPLEQLARVKLEGGQG